jgi:hypothetical protein
MGTAEARAVLGWLPKLLSATASELCSRKLLVKPGKGPRKAFRVPAEIDRAKADVAKALGQTNPLSPKIGDDSRMCCQQAEVMTMSKPKTELEQRCPSPPYTRWDQRGKPVLLSYLKRINGKSLCLSLETEDPEVAKRHMRRLVVMLLAKGSLSPDCGAAEAYGPKGTGGSRIEKFNTEVRRLTALSDAKYGAEALATAKRWGCPVGIIHHLAGRKPKLSAGTYRTRRMRARKRGRMMPIGDTWEHRPQGANISFGTVRC